MNPELEKSWLIKSITTFTNEGFYCVVPAGPPERDLPGSRMVPTQAEALDCRSDRDETFLVVQLGK
jgi:hypothetical protein